MESGAERQDDRSSESSGLSVAAGLGERPLEGHGEPESGAASGVAFRPDMASHQFHQLLANGQAQAGAAIFPGRGPICLHERLKQF